MLTQVRSSSRTGIVIICAISPNWRSASPNLAYCTRCHHGQSPLGLTGRPASAARRVATIEETVGLASLDDEHGVEWVDEHGIECSQRCRYGLRSAIDATTAVKGWHPVSGTLEDRLLRLEELARLIRLVKIKLQRAISRLWHHRCALLDNDQVERSQGRCR